ncbi:hypothetical protein IscW_ISCW009833 [Ixodes scapularis]|uniref:Uncharacterized protein n=1 Tax=Ixodes scapularis TaxID=6945 RepID=B7Q248_IXOSC|nr:hypothetical protein IscW_ISCW009833 [Ixodes scapularis]|eukprot:XP_002410458.1 hypothetical protein IscW_ISCW009833 [Ixodes scapularis]
MGRPHAVRDPPRGDAAALVVGRMTWDVAFADAIRAALVRAPGAGTAALPAVPPPLQGHFRQDQQRLHRKKRPTLAAY